MLMKSDQKPYIDLSAELNDELDWKAGTLRAFEHHLDISAWAYEAVSGVIAIGTSYGIINLYGGPGVEHRVESSDRVAVRSLHFASSIFRLLCVDSKDRLNVWDLNTPGKPKMQSVINFNHPINYVVLSSSHSHAFIALANGEIQTYDLMCSRKSQFTMPNLWALYERRVLAGGMSSRAGSQSQLPIELVVHPRDLNLLFVAYGGGVVMSDLTQRNTVRAFEYIIPPGAPGGTGYHGHQDLLTHRRPDVTALAVHPCGHLFAVGYTDGSIAFWAVEDEDKPLMVLTLDGEHDINIADSCKFDEAMSKGRVKSSIREPIFKLAWSGFANSDDPRGGDTVLTVLGGLKEEDVPGVTALLLPAFNPPEPSSSTAPDSQTLHPEFRAAMRQSVTPKNLHTYSTVGTPQDFLLLPRESPHFAGTYDPYAILLLSDGEKEARAIETYQYPPPIFAIHEHTEPTPSVPRDEPEQLEDVLSDEIALTLESMQLNDEPKSLEAPPSFWSGPLGVISGDLISLERDAYEALVHEAAPEEEGLRLQGGSAWVDDIEGQMKLLRFQPHRMLATFHSDLTVRFRDLSAQLLQSSDTNPLRARYPNPLPSLTLDVLALLADPSVASQTSPKLVEEAHIVSLQLAPQSLECAVALKSGEVTIFRMAGVPAGEAAIPRTLDDTELISATHVCTGEHRRFQPHFLLSTRRGPVSAVALSDIGFLATAYEEGAIFIVDMRGPRILLRETSDRAGRRRSFLRSHADPVVSLVWTVAGTDGDIFPRVRLLATRESGTTAIYTLSRTPSGIWSVGADHATTEGISHAIPGASFVLDIKTGAARTADKIGLVSVMHADAGDAQKGTAIWVVAGAKSVKSVLDITGERLGRAEWPSKAGKVESVVVVRKNTASTLLVAYTDKREALVYSLPYLEHMHSLQIPQSSTEPLSVDGTGDYIEWKRHPCGLIYKERYGTLFNVRRSGPYEAPQVDFAARRKTVPPQPQPVSVGPTSFIGSWIGYITSATLTGDQIDTLLGGPDRPIPQPKPQRPKPSATGSGRSSGSGSRPDPQRANSVSEMANSASRGVNDLYSRLNNALAERGEMLGGLEESFQSLESGSKNMLAQAKSLAAKQSAKRWFDFS
ncbi:uncharacterized protein PHACADRAFT_169080 [Phanerochaete carnosa HHB-10118-sp]|uniref:Lethal giant larvae (Lgl)-like C-terminal domain-containing protein n=1 Tax=Phanerochaete carnosa (strain HHB-10118-sp) TaxID=650164 RepID=K5WQU1_PHACS|nr:uncharacterized protein PHACADRAFT_169080 [Phanerochaete carnosa HHB-10118-sp]EKM61629.1 hypothetical protein PHACADRAFT_169080 [Phanerochaete carnosa HHB-10118-sp]